jgi:putative tricarboxylic transport membrane protein
MKADRASSLFWLAVGLMAVYGSIKLGLGSLQQPGSGFLPFLAGSFICLMALIVFFQPFFNEKSVQPKIWDLWKGTIWNRPLILCLLILAYILALEKIGFLLTTFIILGIMFKGAENLSLWKTTLLSALASATAFLLFDTLLKASLPKGIFGF